MPSDALFKGIGQKWNIFFKFFLNIFGYLIAN